MTIKINMALLARPKNSVIKINEKTSRQFLEESSKRVIDPNFLRKCQDYSRILNNNINYKGEQTMKQIKYYKYKALSENHTTQNRIYEVIIYESIIIYFDDYSEVKITDLSNFELSTFDEYEKQKIEELIKGAKVKYKENYYENRSDIIRNYHVNNGDVDYHLKTHVSYME